MSLPESPHPFSAATATYPYTVPAWPGGTNTVYVTFSLDTYMGPEVGDLTLTVTSSAGSTVYLGATLSGNTLAITSNDGVLSFVLAGGWPQSTLYGLRVTSITLASPVYLIGNPNPEDNPPIGGLPAPSLLHTQISTPPFLLLPGQVGTAYSYQMRFLADATQAWSVTTGVLPTGLTLNGSTGAITGTPTTVGQYAVTIKVVTATATVSQQFLLNVFGVPVTPDAATRTYVPFENVSLKSQCFIEHSGNLYLLLSAGAGHSGLSVYKSTDSGATWSVKDQANEPPVPTGTYGSQLVLGFVYDQASTVHVVYATDYSPSGTSLSTVLTFTRKNFSFTTDTWSAPFSGTETMYSRGRQGSCTLLSNGNLRLFVFASLLAPGLSQMYLLSFDSDGASWTGPNTVYTPSALFVTGSADLMFASVTQQPDSFVGGGVIDVTHIWYSEIATADNGAFYIRCNAAGAGSQFFAAPTADYPNAGQSGFALLDSATDSLAQPFLVNGTPGTGFFSPAVYRGTPLAAPVWTLELVAGPDANDTTNQVTMPEDTLVSLFMAVDGRQACIWVGSHDPYDLNSFYTSYFLSYYNPANPAAAWTPREEIYSCYWNPYPNQSITGFPLEEASGVLPQTNGFYLAFVGDQLHLVPNALVFLAAPLGRVTPPAPPATPGVQPRAQSLLEQLRLESIERVRNSKTIFGNPLANDLQKILQAINKIFGKLEAIRVTLSNPTLQAVVPQYAFVGRPGASDTVIGILPDDGQFDGNFLGSSGQVGTNPAATATYTILKNAGSIGTVTISTTGDFTFATNGGRAISFTAGDLLTMIAPAIRDLTMANVAFALVAVKITT